MADSKITDLYRHEAVRAAADFYLEADKAGALRLQPEEIDALRAVQREVSADVIREHGQTLARLFRSSQFQQGPARSYASRLFGGDDLESLRIALDHFSTIFEQKVTGDTFFFQNLLDLPFERRPHSVRTTGLEEQIFGDILDLVPRDYPGFIREIGGRILRAREARDYKREAGLWKIAAWVHHTYVDNLMRDKHPKIADATPQFTQALSAVGHYIEAVNKYADSLGIKGERDTNSAVDQLGKEWEQKFFQLDEARQLLASADEVFIRTYVEDEDEGALPMSDEELAVSIFQAGKNRLEASIKLFDMGYDLYSYRALNDANRALNIAMEAYVDLDSRNAQLEPEMQLSSRRTAVALAMAQAEEHEQNLLEHTGGYSYAFDERGVLISRIESISDVHLDDVLRMVVDVLEKAVAENPDALDGESKLAEVLRALKNAILALKDSTTNVVTHDRVMELVRIETINQRFSGNRQIDPILISLADFIERVRRDSSFTPPSGDGGQGSEEKKPFAVAKITGDDQALKVQSQPLFVALGRTVVSRPWRVIRRDHAAHLAGRARLVTGGKPARSTKVTQSQPANELSAQQKREVLARALILARDLKLTTTLANLTVNGERLVGDFNPKADELSLRMALIRLGLNPDRVFSRLLSPREPTEADRLALALVLSQAGRSREGFAWIEARIAKTPALFQPGVHVTGPASVARPAAGVPAFIGR